MAEKISKDAADYSRGMAKSHCGKMFNSDTGYCKHFIGEGMQGNGLCALVKGEIRRAFWCRKFSKAVEK